ncbi:putative biopolymer transport protein [Calothrix sp. NIES-4071]|nr:putative biopolymer transport protein [Calothrix sp. NIES-4071]BAZ55821.1 putative biopolymer transport protein [Calothrix sp. NIES-4105]
MTRIFDVFLAGGLVMYPLLALSVVTFAYAVERIWYWFKLIFQEKQVVHEVLTAAKTDLDKALSFAERSEGLAIGRVLAAPLKLKLTSPETFHLALVAALDREFIEMRRGDKLLESIAAVAPLCGIVGTANGLITVFYNLKSAGADSTNVQAVTSGIGQALIASGAGISLAVAAFVFLRTFIILRAQQMDYFSKVSSELELIYLHSLNQQMQPKVISQDSY